MDQKNTFHRSSIIPDNCTKQKITQSSSLKDTRVRLSLQSLRCTHAPYLAPLPSLFHGVDDEIEVYATSHLLFATHHLVEPDTVVRLLDVLRHRPPAGLLHI
jgi:hypothetical protein